MTLPVVIQPAAEVDILEAALWYGSRAPGLGSEFLRSVEASIAAIRRAPETFPKVRGDVRRALLRRFPYAVYFLPSASAIQVIACFHVRRDPARWRLRVTEDAQE